MNWFLVCSAGFILLFAAIFLWIWVSMRKKKRQEAVRQEDARQEKEKSMKK